MNHCSNKTINLCHFSKLLLDKTCHVYCRVRDLSDKTNTISDLFVKDKKTILSWFSLAETRFA